MSILSERDKPATGVYVPMSAIAQTVEFDDDMMHVSLADGRVISVPIVWFPRLNKATRAERENYEIGPAGMGIHWPDIDEDLSVAGLMAGADLTGA